MALHIFKESDKKVKPKANRIVLFDPSIEHKNYQAWSLEIKLELI